VYREQPGKFEDINHATKTAYYMIKDTGVSLDALPERQR